MEQLGRDPLHAYATRSIGDLRGAVSDVFKYEEPVSTPADPKPAIMAEQLGIGGDQMATPAPEIAPKVPPAPVVPARAQAAPVGRMRAIESRANQKFNRYAAKERKLSDRLEETQDALGGLYEQKAHERASIVDQQMREQKAMNAKQQESQAEYQDRLAGARKDVEDKIRVANSMGVDSQRWLNQGNNRTVAALASALSTFGAGISGGRATAVDLIDRFIERDIEEQRGNVQRANRAVDYARGRVAETRDEQDDTVRNNELARASLERKYATLFTNLAEEYGDSERGVLAQQSAAELAQRSNDRLLGLAERQASLGLQVAGAENQAANQAASIKAQLEEAYAKQSTESRKLSLPGVDGTAVNPDAHKKAYDTKNISDRILVKAAELRRLVKAKGSETWDRSSIAKAQSLATSIQLAHGVANELGALSEGDLDMIKRLQSTDPLSEFRLNETEVAKIDTMMKDVFRDADIRLKNAGFGGYSNNYWPPRDDE